MFAAARLAVASYKLFKNPRRLDAVLDAATVLSNGEGFDDAIAETDPIVREALFERRPLKVDLVELRALPEGTMGRAVADHCDRWGIDPAAFPDRPSQTNSEFAVAHLEASHDVWHAVTGFGSDEAGELGLQAFYLAQFENRLGLLLFAIANLHMFTKRELNYHDVYDEITRGWQMGKQAKALFGFDWASHWERPLAEVQQELDLAPPI